MDQSANRGVKRKRYEPPQEEMSVRVGGKLHHEMKEVHKASKKAKVFETQKVVKRLKDIRKKDETDKSIAEFEAELTTLKEIDHDAIGNSALRSKVLKDHTLRDNEDVQTAMTKELESNLFTPGAPGTTLAKIQSRLLSSKILAAQVSASIVALKILLNPALKQRDNATSIKSDPAQSSDRPSKTRKTAASHEGPTASKSDGPLMELNGEADEDEDEEESAIDEAEWESGSIGEDGVDADGWESGSIGSGRSGGADSEDSDEESDEDLDSGDEELRVKPIQPANSKPPKRGAAGAVKPAGASSAKMESTFLPSLSVGFVRGSDDSDVSEAEDAAADMPKKNRRGQRARQAIWEKKFGRNANHKKKEAEALAAAQKNKSKGHARPINTGSNALPTGQAPPGSSRAQARGKAVSQQHQPVDGGWAGRIKDASGASKVVSKPTAKPDKNEQKLHPSWEAKRKLKEKESVGIVPSQGKKIVFT